jgi:hypothetical protein
MFRAYSSVSVPTCATTGAPADGRSRATTGRSTTADLETFPTPLSRIGSSGVTRIAIRRVIAEVSPQVAVNATV